MSIDRTFDSCLMLWAHKGRFKRLILLNAQLLEHLFNECMHGRWAVIGLGNDYAQPHLNVPFTWIMDVEPPYRIENESRFDTNRFKVMEKENVAFRA
jgi:hypothetical protein